MTVTEHERAVVAARTADRRHPGGDGAGTVAYPGERDDLPGVAENAMQGGLHVASCIRRELEGKPRKPYRYRDLGSAAYISRGQALLEVGPVRLSGFPGWVAWGLLHIAFLTGVRNRVSTVVTWLATIARASRYHRAFMLGDQDAIAGQRYTWSTRDDES